jgi:hypothetical protein
MMKGTTRMDRRMDEHSYVELAVEIMFSVHQVDDVKEPQ